MADDWKPSKEETNIIYSFALQNCLEHGQAQIGSIMGRLSQNFDMKKYGRLLPRYAESLIIITTNLAPFGIPIALRLVSPLANSDVVKLRWGWVISK